MTCEITIAEGVVALVDAQDYGRVVAHPWHVLRDATGLVKYARSSIKAPGSDRHRTVLMHRFILDAATSQMVDHRNGDGLDNRRANLRVATPLQNGRNSKARGATGLNGVRRVAAGKFMASIAPNGLEIYLGTYQTAEAAAAVYNAAANIAYREFARLNPGGSSPDVLAAVIADKQRTADRLLAEIAELTRRGK